MTQNSCNKKGLIARWQGGLKCKYKKSEEARTYSPALGSTIGAAGCHGRVRDGNGWVPGAGLTSSSVVVQYHIVKLPRKRGEAMFVLPIHSFESVRDVSLDRAPLLDCTDRSLEGPPYEAP